jgi:Uncharacterized conserved protein
MKGYVQLACKDRAGEYNLDKFDIKLQIVLSIKQGLKTGFIHVPHLAPSEGLYSVTMYKWKKLKFTKEEKERMRVGETGTWWDLYKERFIKEANESDKFKRAYKRLKEHLDSGRNIILICYCDDVTRCHRSIIGEMLVNDGYNVIFE